MLWDERDLSSSEGWSSLRNERDLSSLEGGSSLGR